MDTNIEKLDNLFEKWKSLMKDDETIPQNDIYRKDGVPFFTYDGIYGDKEMWYNSPSRVLFVLKDQYQRLDTFGHHSDDNIQDWNIEKRKNSRFFANIANVVWGLSNIKDGKMPEWNSISSRVKQQEVRNHLCEFPFAVVECKKLPGEDSISPQTLTHHIDKYGSFILKEIELLNANFIVCCSQEIYSYVVENYGGALIEFENQGHGEIRYDKLNNIYIIKTLHHPSYYGKASSLCEFYEYIKKHFDGFNKLLFSK